MLGVNPSLKHVIVNLNPICEIIKIGSVIVAEFQAINSLMKSPCADKEALIINRSKNNNIAGFLKGLINILFKR